MSISKIYASSPIPAATPPPSIHRQLIDTLNNIEAPNKCHLVKNWAVIQDSFIQTLERCIQNGLNVNMFLNFPGAEVETTLLHLFSLHDCQACVDLLVQHGVEKNQQNGRGWTPLMVAVSANHPAIIESLLKAGAEIDLQDRQGRTALIIAVQLRNFPIVQYLVERGADISTPISGSWTPHMMALGLGNYPIANYLAKQGAEIARDHPDWDILQKIVLGRETTCCLDDQGSFAEFIQKLQSLTGMTTRPELTPQIKGLILDKDLQSSPCFNSLTHYEYIFLLAISFQEMGKHNQLFIEMEKPALARFLVHALAGVILPLGDINQNTLIRETPDYLLGIYEQAKRANQLPLFFKAAFNRADNNLLEQAQRLDRFIKLLPDFTIEPQENSLDATIRECGRVFQNCILSRVAQDLHTEYIVVKNDRDNPAISEQYAKHATLNTLYQFLSKHSGIPRESVEPAIIRAKIPLQTLLGFKRDPLQPRQSHSAKSLKRLSPKNHLWQQLKRFKKQDINHPNG